MSVISTLINSVPVVVGIAVLALGWKQTIPMVTGIVLIILGLLIR